MVESTIVVGAGIFGVTAALALRRRGRDVLLLDPGPLPHPLAESTDISKIVRLDYGADATYLALMEEALDGWRRWNADWPRPLFHETGVAFLAERPLEPGGFEHESLTLLAARGHPVDRLDAGALRRRFPAWNSDRFVDGYYNPLGGWVESGRVVEQLLEEARAAGVEVRARQPVRALAEGATGVALADGTTLHADRVIVAAGAWTPLLVPDLEGELRASGQPVFHLRPADAALYVAERFPVFGADISRTGYYGFPVNGDGIVKIANHGRGQRLRPDEPRHVTPADEGALRAFLAGAFHGPLATAPIVATRLCVYCDTWDEHLWIARHPTRAGLTVASGGSGHAFKMAPLLGDLIADAADGIDRPILHRFRWRPGLRPARGDEAARHRGD